MAAERVRPAADAVDPDPLAAARTVGTRALDGDLEDVPADPAFDTGEVVSPTDELAVGTRPMRPAPTEQRDRLEQARLPRGVGSPDQVWAGFEGRVY